MPTTIRIARFASPFTSVRGAALFLLLVVLGGPSMLWAQPRPARAGAAQDGDSLLRFIPPSAVVAVASSPRSAMLQPELELLPREVVSAVGMKELGFDPLDVEQVVAFMEAPAEGAVTPGYGTVLRFVKPCPREGLLPMLLTGATPEQLNKRPFYRSQDPALPSVYFLDDRTLVLASDPVLPAMLDHRAEDGPLVALLRPAIGKQLASVAVDIDPLRAMIQGAMGMMPQVPPPLNKFLAIPDLVSKAEFHVAYGRNMAVRLVVHSPDDEAAGRLEGLINEGIELGQQMLIEQISQELGREGDPVEAAMGAYVQRIVGGLATRLKPKRETRRVEIAVESEINMATSGVMVALLLPAVQAAREAARRVQGMNSLKSIALAMYNCHDATGRFPAAASFDADGKPLLSWRVHILPYIEEEALYKEFHLDEPWDSEHNRKLIPRMPRTYASANNPEAAKGMTNYVVLVGEDTVFGSRTGTRFRDITDGTSNTLMTAEVANSKAVVWTKPDDLQVDPSKPLDGLTGLRPGGFNAGMCDGSVRFIAATIDLDLLRALLTKSGGEVVSLP